ncbi:MAG: hypothetical protein WC822_01535 [Candidatus Paceibacterota bacterium]|jgi:hypothetical protein
MFRFVLPLLIFVSAAHGQWASTKMVRSNAGGTNGHLAVFYSADGYTNWVEDSGYSAGTIYTNSVSGSNAWVWVQANSNKVAYMNSWTNQYDEWSNSWKWVHANSSGVARVFVWTNQFVSWSNTVKWVIANSNKWVTTNDTRFLNWLGASDVWVSEPDTSNSAVNRAYVDRNIVGSSDWYINGSASGDVAGYQQMRRTNSLTSMTNTYAAVGTGTYLDRYVTILGQPNLPYVEAGVWSVSVYAYKGAPGTATISAELYLRNSGGTEYYEFDESTISAPLTTTKTLYTLYFNVPTNFTTALTDRWVVKIKVKTQTGTPTVYIVTGGPLLTHLSAKTSPTVGLNRYGDTMLGKLTLAADIDGQHIYRFTNMPIAVCSNHAAQWGQTTNWVKNYVFTSANTNVLWISVTNWVKAQGYAASAISLGQNNAYVGTNFSVKTPVFSTNAANKVYVDNATNNLHTHIGTDISTATNAVYDAATNAAFTAAKGLTNSIIGNATNKAKAYADATFVEDSKTNGIIALATNSAKSYTDSRYTAGTNWADARFIRTNETRNVKYSGRITFGGLGRTNWFRSYTGDVSNSTYPYQLFVTTGMTNDAAFRDVTLSGIPTNATYVWGHGYCVGSAGSYFVLHSKSYPDGYSIFAGSVQVNALTHHFAFGMPLGGSSKMRFLASSGMSQLYFTLTGYLQ